jgi:hypothetical protein
MEYEPNLTESERSFFADVGPRLEGFADDHNVKVEKWFKDVALWALTFRHPAGGAAHIVIGPVEDGPEAHHHATWWVDDYDSETRRLASGQGRRVGSGWPVLEDALLEEIRRVLKWTERDLTQESKMQKGMWHTYISREQFGRFAGSLPYPRL